MRITYDATYFDISKHVCLWNCYRMNSINIILIRFQCWRSFNDDIVKRVREQLAILVSVQSSSF